MRAPFLARGLPALGLVVVLGAPAVACEPRLALSLAEGSPRDELRLENLSVGPWALVRLEIDLAASAGDLIFDSAAGGGGVAAFRELRVEAGATLAGPAFLTDGAQTATILFEPVGPGAAALLTLDLDSRAAGGFGAQIMSAEIAQAEARALFTGAHGEVETFGVFDDRGDALLEPGACS